MSTLRTAGELRAFLADVLEGIKGGKIDTNKANAIAKVAAQINASLQTEVTTALQLQKMGKHVPGEMVIGAAPVPEETPAEIIPPAKPIVVIAPPPKGDEKIWCEQCEAKVTVSQAVSCKSAFCKARAVA